MLQGLKAVGIVLLVLGGLFLLDQVPESTPPPARPPEWERLRISTPPTIDERWPTTTYVCRECPDDDGPYEPDAERYEQERGYR